MHQFSVWQIGISAVTHSLVVGWHVSAWPSQHSLQDLQSNQTSPLQNPSQSGKWWCTWSIRSLNYGRTDCTFHLRISWVWPNYVTKKSSWSQTGSRIQILIRIGRVELNPDPVGFLLIRAKTIQQLKGKQWATHNRKN